MSLSKLKICQHALLRIGSETITSLDDSNKEARLCNTFYDQTLKEVLREYKWNATVARAELVQTINTPLYGYDYSFQLPLDFSRLLQIYDNRGNTSTDYNYVIEGTELLTDLNEVYIKYIKEINDPLILDPICTQAIICKLASRLAYPMTSERSLETSLIQEYESVIMPKAKHLNAFEINDYKEMADSWIDSRNYGGF